MPKRKAPQGPTKIANSAGPLYGPSSTKLPKPTGLAPAKPKYGITQTGGKSEQSLAARAGRMFGNRSRNTPNGQARLSSKAKRQVQ